MNASYFSAFTMAAFLVLAPGAAGALAQEAPASASAAPLAPAPAFAQEARPSGPAAAGSVAPIVHRMTLAQVTERARAVSPRLDQLRFLEQGAEAGLSAARAERRPLLDLTASYARYSNIPELTILFPPPAGPQTIFPNIQDNYATRVGVTVPIYTGGRLQSLIGAAEKETRAAGMDVETGRADLVLEAGAAYWDLVTAIASERVLREALLSYDAHLKDAANREKFGIAARNEVLAVQVERERAELARLRAANAMEVINANLIRILDLPLGSRVDPAEPLEGARPPEEDLSALVDRALAARPERAALRSRIEAADERTRAARADNLPQARLSAGYDYARPNRRILPIHDQWDDTWDASVSLAFRLFDGGRTAAAIAQRTAEADAARKQLEDLEQRIRLEVTQRFVDLQTAAASVAVAERNLESARENQRVAGDRYRAGVIPSSELLDAETALLRAGLERTGSHARQRLGLAELDRAVGR